MLEQSLALRRPFADIARPSLEDGLLAVLALDAMAEAQRLDGLPTEAARSADEAIRRSRALVVQNPNDNNNSLSFLAHSLRQRALALALNPAQINEASQAIDEAVAILERLPAQFSQTPGYRVAQAQALTSRGEIRAAAGRQPDADADFVRARVLLEQLAKERPESDEHAGRLGRVLGHLGERALARSDSEGAITLLDAALLQLGRALKANPEDCVVSSLKDRLGAVRKATSARPLEPR
jgi:tetratricopeptide (TPR) repeat protein